MNDASEALDSDRPKRRLLGPRVLGLVLLAAAIAAVLVYPSDEVNHPRARFLMEQKRDSYPIPNWDSTSLTIRNDTDHVLKIRYSGPSSVRVDINPRETRRINLTPGSYSVEASVWPEIDVRNYAGLSTYEVGFYGSSFVIRESLLRSPAARSTEGRNPFRRRRVGRR